MKSFDLGAEAPTAAETCRTSGLARVREPSFDLVLEYVAHIEFERRLLAGETPGLLRLVRLAGFRESQRVARAGIGRIQRDPADDAVVGVVAIGHVGIERDQDVRFRRPDLAHELLAQLEAFHDLAVAVAEACNTFHSPHIRGRFLLALPEARHLRPGFARGPGALIAARG